MLRVCVCRERESEETSKLNKLSHIHTYIYDLLSNLLRKTEAAIPQAISYEITEGGKRRLISSA